MLWLFLPFVVILSGVVAYAADTIAKKVGRRHLRWFGLRPKQTAVIVAVLAGMGISAASLGAFLWLNSSAINTIATADQLRPQIEALRADLQLEVEQVNSVKAQLRSAQQEQSEAEQAGAAAREEARTAQAQQQQAEAALKTAQDALKKAQDDQKRLQASVTDLQKRTKQSRQQLKDSEVALQNSQKKVETLDGQVVGLQTDIALALVEVDTARKRADDAQRRADALDTQAVAARQDLVTAQNTLKRAQAQLQEARQQRAEAISARDAAVKARQAAARARDAAVADRDAAIKARDAAVKARDALVAEKNALAKQRDGLIYQRNRVQQDLDALRKSRDALASELQAAQNSLRAVQADYSSARDELAASRGSDLAYPKNELVYAAVVPSVRNLDAFLQTAAREAQKRGSRGTSENPSAATLERAARDKLETRLRGLNAATFVLCRAAQNSAVGFPVELTCEARPNDLLYRSGEAIRRVTVNPQSGARTLQEQIGVAVTDAVLDLTRRGVPAEYIRGGGLNVNDFVTLLAQLTSLDKAAVTVSIAAREDVKPGSYVNLYATYK